MRNVKSATRRRSEQNVKSDRPARNPTPTPCPQGFLRRRLSVGKAVSRASHQGASKLNVVLASQLSAKLQAAFSGRGRAARVRPCVLSSARDE